MRLLFDCVTASYHEKNVLRGISFAVPEKSITALIGRNGAGKSTLVHCLTGQKQNYRGQILLDGLDSRRMDLRQRAHRLSCLPQILPQPHVSVWDLVSFGRTPYTPITGKLSDADFERICWALESVGICEQKDSYVDTLSGGELRKAFFAMTLAQDTPLVVLDEPTAHLDAASKFEFLDLLDRMRQQTDKTFLIIMHDLPEVLRYADRVVALHEGCIAFDGTPEEALSAEVPQTCFGIQIVGDKAKGFAALPLK